MEISQIIDATFSGKFTQGDVVSWSEATWDFVGNVRTVKNYDSETFYFPNLFKLADLNSLDDCMNLCP